MFPKTGLVLLLLACASFLVPTIRSMQSRWSTQSDNSSSDPVLIDNSNQPSEPVNKWDNLPSVDSGSPTDAPLATAVDSVASTDDQDYLADLLSLVTDNALTVHKREMPAYWRLLAQAKSQDFASLREKARHNPSFNDFYTAAQQHRGELVSMVLNVRRVIKYDAMDGSNAAGVKQLYEVWGWTEQSKSWLYVCVTPELPEGLSIGDAVSFRAQFSGYFFKLLAYHSAKPTASGKPLVAPMLIGRFDAAKPLLPANRSDPLQALILVIFGLVCVGGFFMRWFLRRSDRAARSTERAETQRDESTRFDWIDDIQPTSPSAHDGGRSALDGANRKE